ncbi:Type IIA topoisomerase (DNA gyrase/topo II, topoisomerase IV), A subunit [Pseudomonas sp. RIT357]|nr:Type IIA topoisomerase (DNA gyrase/topo II, topoisomerase IV), A subunit [Pseudomonas sp. RIT357]
MTPFALKKVSKEMKALVVMALSSLCATAALADEAPTELAGQNAPIVEDYTYSTHLDVAKVLSMSEVPNVCEVVPAKMEYEDSQGQRHILNYKIMGNGCSNG